LHIGIKKRNEQIADIGYSQRNITPDLENRDHISAIEGKKCKATKQGPKQAGEESVI
jgi:hypothetical protein